MGRNGNSSGSGVSVRGEEMKIFISGKITGVKDYMARFEAAEKFLEAMGYEGNVINPAKVCDSLPKETTEYEEYIDVTLTLLKQCDAVFMLDGWEESRGASLEWQYATTFGYEIFYEKKILEEFYTKSMLECVELILGD